MTFGEKLTKLREKRGWTKVFTAKKLGIGTVSTYANWEYDIRQPDNDTVVKLANLFEVTTDYLLGVSPDPRLTKQQAKEVDEIILKIMEEVYDASDEVKENILQALRLYNQSTPNKKQ